MMQVPGTLVELAANAPGTSTAFSAAKSSALRLGTVPKAKVPRQGSTRSMFDPPVHPAVEPITFADYPKKTHDALKRKLQTEDAENVSNRQFEKGELVFTLQEAGVDKHGYELPLSVGFVNKVSPCGWQADVTYMWGTSWDGTFRKAQFKDAKGNTKNWTHKDMTKQGVVLMRGRQTASHHLNQKTKEYLCEVLGEESYYKHAKRPRAKAAAKDQPKRVKPKARAARNGPHPSSQAGRVIPDASCLRQGRPRAKRIHESESSECDKSDGSSSDTSAASVETCTSTDSEEILNVKISSKNTKKRASVVQIERDRGSRPSQK